MFSQVGWMPLCLPASYIIGLHILNAKKNLCVKERRCLLNSNAPIFLSNLRSGGHMGNLDYCFKLALKRDQWDLQRRQDCSSNLNSWTSGVHDCSFNIWICYCIFNIIVLFSPSASIQTYTVYVWETQHGRTHHCWQITLQENCLEHRLHRGWILLLFWHYSVSHLHGIEPYSEYKFTHTSRLTSPCPVTIHHQAPREVSEVSTTACPDSPIPKCTEKVWDPEILGWHGAASALARSSYSATTWKQEP